ncbi:MAG: phosphotyrosine protein phosphatase [Piscirickettsiaceae bacterium]|nr:MAG: phosphotyrosine protein phosphatase [Piscirickettsiaceae bacterium]PCI67296.1 MAG: phosphotyrosine protein phosphatase [Piscirickettsiaceae bacterium]
MKQTKVLFICMGNICRSPTAHGVFQQLVDDNNLTDKVFVDSAGTHAYHVGHAPDKRSVSTALAHGVDMRNLTARQVHESDFEYFDYLLVMDSHNHALVFDACPKEYQAKVQYFLEFASNTMIKEVPDPYYGEGNGFERVYDLIVDASSGLMSDIMKCQKPR